MRSRQTYILLLVTAVLTAAAVAGSLPAASADQPRHDNVWPANTVKQKMLRGEDVVGLRVTSSDPTNYCTVASTSGTDFTWTDMVHSGLEFSYVWPMWATPCSTAVAHMVGAEIFYSKRVDFTTKAYFRSATPRDPQDHPGPGRRAADLFANELQTKEMQRATDGGAMVIIINVDNALQAEQVVERAYYPPMGARDLGPGQYNTVYPSSVTGGNYVGTYDQNLTVIAGISTVEGVSRADRIAATEGIHALYLDVMDLESESGYAQGSPDFSRLEDAVTDAARDNQKYLCTADRTTTPNTLTCVAHPTRKH